MVRLPLIAVRPLASATASRSSLFSCWESIVAGAPRPSRLNLHSSQHRGTVHVSWRTLTTTTASCCWVARVSEAKSVPWVVPRSPSQFRLFRQYSDKHEPQDHAGERPEEQRPHHKPFVSASNRPLVVKLDATRQRTKDLTEKVRSSLPSLTPHENIYNVPNFLTASRLVAAPIVGYLVLHEQHKYALALFAYAGVTDLLDGWLARRFNLQTVVGSVVDPMADKMLMTILTVTLAVKGLLPAYLATLILGRDVALAVAALYYRYASLPAPKTFQRYWDFSLPSAEVHPTTMSKYNTFLQLLLIGSTLAYPVITADNHHLGVMYDLGLDRVGLETMMTYFQWTVAGTTIWSGLSYSYLKNVVKILGTDEKLKAKQGQRGRAIIGVTYGSILAIAAWMAVSAQRQEPDDSELSQLV